MREPHPTAMLDEPGAVLRWVFARFFREIAFPPEVREKIAAAAARGQVVYVTRALSFFDYLYFTFAFLQHGLPLAGFANGARTLFIQPLRRLLRGLVLLWQRRRRSHVDEMREVVEEGGAVMLSMRRARTPLGGEPRTFRGPYVEELLQLGRSQPIVFVPIVVLWGSPAVRAAKAKKGLIDLVFGERETPGPLRALWQFLSHYKHSQVLCGAPIALDDFFAAEPGLPDEVLARRLRFRLNGALESEVRVVLGPVRKGSRRIVEEVMRSRRVVREGQSVAREEGLDARQLERRARRILNEIAADPKPWAIGFLKTLVGWLLGRMFDGFELDMAGLERVREAAHRGPVIFVPSHKSHFDYLILSYLVSERDLVPPHIAAGANLSFFPLGFIFRRCGAFFLRRKMKGDKLYSLLFRAYVRRLLREGHNLEFFIEGGRSRSGKLLTPKLGLLGMVVEAALDDDGQRARQAQIVPVSIGYEKVIEGQAHAREQAGGSKKKESVRGLVGASRVLLGDYGRLNIQFDEPIPLGAALAELGALVAWDEGERVVVPAGEDSRRAAVQRLGFRIVHGINRVTALTPTALIASVLLSSGRRTLARGALVDGARFLLSRARAAGARLAGGLVEENGGVAIAAVDHALDFFLRDGDIEQSTVGVAVYDVPEDRRSRLAFYRNNAIHFFVAESIVALALLDAAVAGAEPVVTRGVLRERALGLSRLLKLEFVYRPGEPFDTLFGRTLAGLGAAGVISDENGRVHGVDVPSLELLAGLLRDFVAAYRLVDELVASLDGAVTPRELVRRATALGEARAASGALDRPEACVPATFSNAVDALVERGVLVEDGEQVRRAISAGPRASSGASTSG